MSFHIIHKSTPFIFSFLSSFAYANNLESQVDEPSYTQDTVVVTATRTSRTVNETVSSVKVITREEIVNSQAQSVPDLLRGIAGVHITQNGGRGGNSSLFLRGTNSDHVIVLIDGVKIGSATSGTAAFQNLPMEQIERVEIVRGPRSSLYGSEALGGVVQIFTKKGGGKTSISSHATVGSHDTYELSAGIAGGGNNLFYNLSVEGEKTGGIDSCRAESATEFGGCFADQPDSDGFDKLAGSMRLGYRFDGGSEMSLFGLRSDSESDFDGSFQDNSDNQQRVIGWNYLYQFNQNIDMNLSYSLTEDLADSYIQGGFSSKFDTKRENSSLQVNMVLFDRDILTYGVDYQKDKVRSSLLYTENERETVGLFSQYLVSLNKHDVEMSVRHDFLEDDDSAFTGSIGYAYALEKNHRLFLSYGTAFKQPSFNELYYPGFGVPTLEPEESKSFEVGLRGNNEISNTRWSLSFFSTKVDELIGYDSSFNQLNIDKASIRGLELELTQKIDLNWILSADLSFVSPLNRSAGANDGNLLARRPKTSGRINLDYLSQGWSVGATVIHSGTRFDNAANTKKLKAYQTVDLKAQYEINKNFILQGRIENVFDSTYETAQFYNQPGRGLFVTLRYATK